MIGRRQATAGTPVPKNQDASALRERPLDICVKRFGDEYIVVAVAGGGFFTGGPVDPVFPLVHRIADADGQG